MFDIVSKNKKLSFLVSYIHDINQSNTFASLVSIQKNSPFIQTKLKVCTKKIIQTRFHIQKIKNKHTKTPLIVASVPSKNDSHKQNKQDIVDDISILSSKLYSIDHQIIKLDSMIQPEYMLYAFLICIDSNFIHTQDHLKESLIDTLKYTLAVELDTKNLYKEFNYNKIRSLKKTIVQNSLFNNKDIQYIHLYRYLGDYFNVNFICIIDGIFVQYFNEYKQDRMHIVISQNKNIVHIDTSLYDDELIYIKNFNPDEYIPFPGQTVKAYNKLKVTEIRKISEKKNINLYISGLKKKTKKMLIEEILQI
jgi:hypothetical protein